MKKLFLILMVTGLVSFLFGNYIFTTYKKNMEEVIKSASSIYEKVYMLQYGSYKDKDKAISNAPSNYILENVDGFYKVYVGVTLTNDSANIIKDIYKRNNVDIYIKEKMISNFEFIELLNVYEDIFINKTEEEILSGEDKIIKKYKELVLNE